MSRRLAGQALVALIALVLGLALGRLSAPAAPAEGSPEVTFARDMAAHHSQAVDMALILYDRSEDEALRRLSLDIFTSQGAQVGQMDGWLAAWGRPVSGLRPAMAGMGQRMGMASQAAVNALRSAPLEKAEISFLRLMIRHHQGGVQMADSFLKTVSRPEVRRLASAITAAQNVEIRAMKGMLEARGASPLPEPEPVGDDGAGHDGMDMGSPGSDR